MQCTIAIRPILIKKRYFGYFKQKRAGVQQLLLATQSIKGMFYLKMNKLTRTNLIGVVFIKSYRGYVKKHFSKVTFSFNPEIRITI